MSCALPDTVFVRICDNPEIFAAVLEGRLMRLMFNCPNGRLYLPCQLGVYGNIP